MKFSNGLERQILEGVADEPLIMWRHCCLANIQWKPWCVYHVPLHFRSLHSHLRWNVCNGLKCVEAGPEEMGKIVRVGEAAAIARLQITTRCLHNRPATKKDRSKLTHDEYPKVPHGRKLSKEGTLDFETPCIRHPDRRLVLGLSAECESNDVMECMAQ